MWVEKVLGYGGWGGAKEKAKSVKMGITGKSEREVHL